MSMPWKAKVEEMLQIRDDWRGTTSECSEWSWIWKKLIYRTLWGEDLVLCECVISWCDHSTVGVKKMPVLRKYTMKCLGVKGHFYTSYSACLENVCTCVYVERDTQKKREKHGKILIGKYKWRVQRCSL